MIINLQYTEFNMYQIQYNAIECNIEMQNSYSVDYKIDLLYSQYSV